MPKYRSTQHREQKEEKKRNKLLAETKRENHQLKRQISRLQKAIQKILDKTEVAEDLEGFPKRPDPLECPDCKQTSVSVIRLPFGNMLVCKECGYRGKA